MDRLYPAALDVAALARIAHTSPRHFTRTFRETFGETQERELHRHMGLKYLAKMKRND